VNIQDIKFDAKTEAVIEKVRKLLALANGNDNEHQAEAAANKARELLEAYNLDLAHISKSAGNGGYAPRDKQVLRGGLYQWQRDLWNMTATLNFCKYWYIRGTRAGSQYEHELLCKFIAPLMHFLLNISTNVDGLNDKTAPDAGAVSGS
jgi:hypothetical protein